MPDDPDPVPALRASDDDRDAVLAVLGEAFGRGRLSAEEFDERQNQALAARLVADLPPLVHDLPEGDDLRRRLGAGEPGSGLAHRSGTGPAVRAGSGPAETTVAVMGGKELVVRPGTPKVRSIALMGGDTIDLTTVLGPGIEVTVETWTMWGGAEIHVPPGVQVIDRTVNVMAGNDVHGDARGDGSAGTLVLTGVSLMAGHDVRLAPDQRRTGSRRTRR